MQEETKNNIGEEAQKVSEAIVESSIWDTIISFLDTTIFKIPHANAAPSDVKIGYVLLIIGVLIITTYMLSWIKKLVSAKILNQDRPKFNTVFSFSKWIIYIVVMLISFDAIGINVTAIFAASTALLIGIGLALQTFFQDIISGVFIIIDQSVHVGDIIEIEGKIGRVEDIKLRTTRAVTIDNKVLIIPNHLYLRNSLYNWTQLMVAIYN